MRIGIDCRTILNPSAGEKAGIAHYTYHLVKTLLKLNKLDEFVLFFDHRARDIVKEFLEPNTVIRFFTFSKYKKFLPFVYSHMLSSSVLTRENLDVYHSPANIVPLKYEGKFVVTVHDLAIYREPSVFPSRQGFSIKYLVPRSIDKAEKIIAVSRSTKKDVEDFFAVASSKIKVIYEGVDHERFNPNKKTPEDIGYLRQKYKINKEYILFLGTLEPRKNLIRLLEAFYQLLQKKPEIAKQYQLVLAGHRGWLCDEIFEEIKNRNLGSSVVVPGYVPGADIPKLYLSSAFFVYPSIYEGFGLPVLEALACGVPVITSNVSSLPEITGDAAVLVDPYDGDGLSVAMENLLGDEKLREQLSRKGQERAKQFSWEKCARETMEVYRAAASQPVIKKP